MQAANIPYTTSGGLCGNDTVRAAFAEFIGMFGHVLGGHIGKHAGRAAANAGQDADSCSYQGGTDGVGNLIYKLLPCKSKAFDGLHLHGLHLAVSHALSRYQDLGDSENTNQGWKGVKSGYQ